MSNMNRPDNEYGDWANPTLKEMPFWREGMTPEEYDTEREYYYKNYDLVRKMKYKPLWVQKKEFKETL